MVGNVAFLMKDAVRLAVSFYLLKENLVKATLVETFAKRQRFGLSTRREGFACRIYLMVTRISATFIGIAT
jgi:hypothetical protein